MSRRVLITGAQGFVGRYLAACWLAERPEDTVLGLGRSRQRPGLFTHRVSHGGTQVWAPLPEALQSIDERPRYRYQPLDLLDLPEGDPRLTALLHTLRPDVVVHMATALRDETPERLFHANVGSALALLGGIARSGIAPPRVVLGSSGAVYGDSPEQPIPEDRTPFPVDLYGASKRAAEDAARLLAARHGIPVLWARIFNPVGPGQDERHVAGALGRQVAAIAPGTTATLEVGPLHTTRDFIDVRDVARAVLLLCERGAPGQAYNVASGEETAIGRLLAELLAAAGLAGQVAITQRPDWPAGVPRHVADIARLRALGFAPRVPLHRSLEDIVAYYRGPVTAAAHAAEQAAGPDGPLQVTVEETHTYPVLVAPGLLGEVPARVKALFPGARALVLTDERVARLYGETLVGALRGAGIDAGVVAVPEGETTKSMDVYRHVIERLYRTGFDRRAVLLCLGGGLICDLGGLVAATYLRGVAYVNLPTTLLAQHDAAIGGKVAVNLPWAKNFVGAFHHPRAVLCDTAVLGTLDERNLVAGIAEAIKVAMAADPGLFSLLERRVADLRGRDPGALAAVVRGAARQKIALLAPDPYERDLRRALNLGHTFGHALEVELGFEGILHGEAVGFGLAVATAVARARGVCSADAAERIYGLLLTYGLPPRVGRRQLHAACMRLGEIRLVRGQRLHFVLPTGVGAVEIVPEVDDGEIAGALHAIEAHPRLSSCVVPE